MRFFYTPYYCGGKLLTGFYTPGMGYKPGEAGYPMAPGEMYRVVKKVGVGYYGESYSGGYPQEQYLPSTLEEFQQIVALGTGFFSPTQGVGNQGVVYAVTNSSQKQGAEWLKATGFKSVGEHSKYPGGSSCTFWVGDFHKDMVPILSKVRNPETQEVKSVKPRMFS